MRVESLSYSLCDVVCRSARAARLRLLESSRASIRVGVCGECAMHVCAAHIACCSQMLFASNVRSTAMELMAERTARFSYVPHYGSSGAVPVEKQMRIMPWSLQMLQKGLWFTVMCSLKHTTY